LHTDTPRNAYILRTFTLNHRGGAMSLIALEEHYAWDPASVGNVVGTWLQSNNTVAYERLYDRGPLRLEQMDAAGIDFQILSLFDPGVQDETDVARAIDLARPDIEAASADRREIALGPSVQVQAPGSSMPVSRPSQPRSVPRRHCQLRRRMGYRA
jgi:hypothetical protein